MGRFWIVPVLPVMLLCFCAGGRVHTLTVPLGIELSPADANENKILTEDVIGGSDPSLLTVAQLKSIVEESVDEFEELSKQKRQEGASQVSFPIHSQIGGGRGGRQISLVDTITNRLSHYNLKVNQTLTNATIGVNFGAAGLQAFLESSSQRRLKSAKSWVERIVDFLHSTFMRISHGVSSLTRGISRILQTVFNRGRSYSSNPSQTSSHSVSTNPSTTKSPFRYQPMIDQ